MLKTFIVKNAFINKNTFLFNETFLLENLILNSKNLLSAYLKFLRKTEKLLHKSFFNFY